MATTGSTARDVYLASIAKNLTVLATYVGPSAIIAST